MNARILPAGETCLFVDFGEAIDLELNGRVQALRRALASRPFRGMKELVPAYRSLAVYFDPLIVDLSELKERLKQELDGVAASAAESAQEVRVPAFFGGDMGPDLPAVAEHTGLEEKEVVRRYCASRLYCFMNGFTPGFPYLGGMDPSLKTPRLRTPRELIPKNSVAIGGAQAGAYSIAAPGGWRIIGRIPYDLYDASREPAVAIQAGMWVRFYPVSMERYREIEAAARRGAYRIEYREGRVER